MQIEFKKEQMITGDTQFSEPYSKTSLKSIKAKNGRLRRTDFGIPYSLILHWGKVLKNKTQRESNQNLAMEW